MPPTVGSATNNYASAAAALPESQGSEGARRVPPGDTRETQAQPGQAREQPHAAFTEHDPKLLGKKMQDAVPAGRLDAVIQQLQALIGDLHRTYVQAAPENAAGGHAGNRPHETQQPNQQSHRPLVQPPVQPPTYCPYGWRRNTGFGVGLGALAGVGLVAGTVGWMGLGGLGFFGATAAVCSVASFGLLGATLYAIYKYPSQLLPSSQNSFWQSWAPVSYLPAVQQSNQATTQQT